MARLGLLAAIFAKDAKLMSRDRFSLLLTGLGLVTYVLIFWLMPSDVDESMRVGVYPQALAGRLAPFADGGQLSAFSSEAELVAAVRGDAEIDVDLGLSFPATLVQDVAAGRSVEVRLVVDEKVPPEVRQFGATMVREIVFAITGIEQPAAIEFNVLGEDRAGNQIPLRDRMRPLLVFIMLLIESFALGALIANEVQARTVTAVTMTRATIGDFLLAKTVFGTLLAFTQGMLLLILLGGMGAGATILIVAVLLGSLLATAMAFVAGASGKEFMTVVFLNVLLMVPMMIPALDLLFPGQAAPWVQLLPSYGLVQAMVGVTNYGDGWGEALPHLGRLIAWCAVLYVTGLLILKRRVENL